MSNINILNNSLPSSKVTFNSKNDKDNPFLESFLMFGSILSIVFGYVAKDMYVGVGTDFLSTALSVNTK